MKHLRSAAQIALLFLLACSCSLAERATGTGKISTSGGQLTFSNTVGGMTVSVEEIIAGSPTTVSIVIQGCKTGGTCATLDTYTTGANATCFTENGVNKVACIPYSNETTGGIVQFSVPTASADIWGIAKGSDGNLYFTERATTANKIGMVTMATGKVVDEWKVPTSSSTPNKIGVGFNNWLIFSEHTGNNIAFLNVTPAGRNTTSTGSAAGSMQ